MCRMVKVCFPADLHLSDAMASHGPGILCIKYLRMQLASLAIPGHVCRNSCLI